MSACARRTVDGRPCQNPSHRGDCGRHDGGRTVPSTLPLADTAPAAAADPFAGAAAWQAGTDFRTSPDPGTGYRGTALWDNVVKSELALRAARQSVGADRDLTAALDATVVADPGPHPREQDGWDDLSSHQRWKANAAHTRAADRHTRAHGPPDPSWTDRHRTRTDPDGTIHAAMDCPAANRRATEGWTVPADTPDSPFCDCASMTVNGLALLRDRHLAATGRIRVANLAADIARHDRLTPADMTRLGAELDRLHDGIRPTDGTEITRKPAIHLADALRVRAQASIPPDTATWLLRLAGRLDSHTGPADRGADSRLAAAMRDAVIIDGVTDHDRIVDRAVQRTDGPLTRKATLRTRAEELLTAAADWAASGAQHTPRSQRPARRTDAKGRLARRNPVRTPAGDPSVSHAPVLWMLHQASQADGRYPDLALANDLAAAAGATVL